MRVNRILAIALFLFLSTVFGCTKKEADPTNAKQDSEKPAESRIEIPDELMTPALRAIGAPFDKPLKMRFSGFAAGITESTRIAKVTAIEDGKVHFTFTWSNGLGDDKYVSGPDGIFVSRQFGRDFDPPVMYAPVNFAIGDEWEQSYTIQVQDNTVEVKSKTKIVGQEKVTLPMGEFDAKVIEETGTLKSPTMDVTMTGKSWLVDGMGIVKMQGTQKGKVNGTEVSQDLSIEIVG
jgi:hypothetical protein